MECHPIVSHGFFRSLPLQAEVTLIFTLRKYGSSSFLENDHQIIISFGISQSVNLGYDSRCTNYKTEAHWASWGDCLTYRLTWNTKFEFSLGADISVLALVATGI